MTSSTALHYCGRQGHVGELLLVALLIVCGRVLCGTDEGGEVHLLQQAEAHSSGNRESPPRLPKSRGTAHLPGWPALSDSPALGPGGGQGRVSTRLEEKLPVSTAGGNTNLSLILLQGENHPGDLAQMLCVAMRLEDCSTIIVTTTDDTEESASAYYRVDVEVQTVDREAALVSLLQHIRHVSFLYNQNILSVYAAGVLVYEIGHKYSLTYDGDFFSCAQTFWYLVFLLVLVPFPFFIGDFFYNCGKRGGLRSAKNAEQEIRASVHLVQASSWARYADMPGQHMSPDRLPPYSYQPSVRSAVHPYQQHVQPPIYQYQQHAVPSERMSSWRE